MPFLVKTFIHYRDCVDFYQRFVYTLDQPQVIQYAAGEFQNLIPTGVKLENNDQIMVKIPLFNKAGNTKIIERFNIQSILYLEIAPGRILSRYYTEPKSVDLDVLYGKEGLIYTFYNGNDDNTIVISGTISEDKNKVFSKIKSNPGDLEYRKYIINQLITQPIQESDEDSEKYPEYMTAAQVADHLQVKEKTIRNWTSQKKIQGLKFSGITKYKRSMIDKLLLGEN